MSKEEHDVTDKRCSDEFSFIESYAKRDQKEKIIKSEPIKDIREEEPEDVYSGLLQNKPKKYTEAELQQRKKAWKSHIQEKQPSFVTNDFPDYFYAGFWIRSFAFLTDLICIFALTSIFVRTPFKLLGWQSSHLFLSPYVLLGILVYLLYFIFLTKWNHGQTIGKMIFGLKVISLQSDELNWSTVLIREGICRYILKNPILAIGYIPAAFSQKKQHMGDFFSDTSVVNINMLKAFQGDRY